MTSATVCSMYSKSLNYALT